MPVFTVFIRTVETTERVEAVEVSAPTQEMAVVAALGHGPTYLHEPLRIIGGASQVINVLRQE